VVEWSRSDKSIKTHKHNSSNKREKRREERSEEEEEQNMRTRTSSASSTTAVGGRVEKICGRMRRSAKVSVSDSRPRRNAI
jgi:hypothetical protein